jgi:hypothetical protein
MKTSPNPKFSGHIAHARSPCLCYTPHAGVVQYNTNARDVSSVLTLLSDDVMIVAGRRFESSQTVLIRGFPQSVGPLTTKSVV